MSVPSSTFTIDEIENAGALPDTGNRYTVCQRSGWKIRPNELSREWNGARVRPWSFDERNDQDYVRNKAEHLRGALRPEPADVFVSVPVTADDL